MTFEEWYDNFYEKRKRVSLIQNDRVDLEKLLRIVAHDAWDEANERGFCEGYAKALEESAKGITRK